MSQATAGVAGFSLGADRLGYFGSRSALQVVWAGIGDEPPGMLAQLCRRVIDELREAAIQFDQAPFRPHITLGRARRGRPAADSAAMRAAIDAVSRWGEGEAPVDDLVLFSSQLRPTGSIYTAVHRQPLSDS